MFTAVSGVIKRMMSMVAIVAVCGIVVSSISLQRHYATSKTAYCDIAATFDCDIVNRSGYSSILGIPVALIGMLGYGALAGLATVYRDRQETPAMLLGAASTGLAFALYLTYIEGHVLGIWCILCLCSLTLIAIATILAGMIWWRRDVDG